MDVIATARELGKLIQQDDRYTTYHSAKEKNDNDTELQDKIGEFNLKRMELNREMGKQEKDTTKISVLDSEIKSLYAEIMANENMAAFTAAKNEMDGMLNQINLIITSSANGEDPATIDPVASCGGGCDTCGGCS